MTDETTIKKLKEIGYSVSIDQYGYKVFLNGKFIHGASVMGNPKMHYAHTRKNLIDNKNSAWSTARQHYQNESRNNCWREGKTQIKENITNLN